MFKYRKLHVGGGQQEDTEENYTDNGGGHQEDTEENYTDVVNMYYDIVTSFSKYGSRKPFHFVHRDIGETLEESMKRHAYFLAVQLGLKQGQEVLDVGCGIGEPLRDIARFRTSIIGLNDNGHEISMGEELNRLAGLNKACSFVRGDFNKMPFPADLFDAVYATKPICHALDAVVCYREIYRVLKPGQLFAAYEWCMTPVYDQRNKEHQMIKAEIELGNGLSNIRLTSQCLDELRVAGFEVVEEEDLAIDSPVPWYSVIDASSTRLSRFHHFCTRNLMAALEKVGVAEKGSQRFQDFLDIGRKGLLAGGKRKIFTPLYCVVARKPA